MPKKEIHPLSLPYDDERAMMSGPGIKAGECLTALDEAFAHWNAARNAASRRIRGNRVIALAAELQRQVIACANIYEK
jgi:hypothetical protein